MRDSSTFDSQWGQDRPNGAAFSSRHARLHHLIKVVAMRNPKLADVVQALVVG
jgi:hypothetical protein